MKKILLLTIIIFNLSVYAQVFTVTSTKFTKTEGQTAGFINLKYSPVSSQSLTLNYTLVGKNSGAVVGSDLSNLSHTGTITFAANDTTEKFTFDIVNDATIDGPDTFIFKLTSASMGTIGQPDSVWFFIKDSTAPTITNRPLYSIAQIRGNNTNGVADSVNKACTIRGTVHGVNWKKIDGLPGYHMSITDGTGWMGIFSNKTYATLTQDILSEGDSVEISGNIEGFNGLSQIKFQSSGDTIKKLGTNTIRTASSVSVLDESTESKLVKIENFSFVSGSWFSDSAFDMKLKTSSNVEYVVRVNNYKNHFSSVSLPLIKSGKKYTITGLAGQFDKDVPATKSFQLIPRSSSDIVETGNSASINSNEKELISIIYPNPLTSLSVISFTSSKSELMNLSVVDLQGRTVYQTSFQSKLGENKMDLNLINTLQKGHYLVQLNSMNMNSTHHVSIQ